VKYTLSLDVGEEVSLRYNCPADQTAKISTLTVFHDDILVMASLNEIHK
jgi:hypothetical protein